MNSSYALDLKTHNESMPWHHEPWQQLQALKLTHLPQALLLSGLQGLGLAAFAKAWCQYLLCEAPASKACGKCRACHLFLAQTHPDFFWLAPQERSINIEQVRSLGQSLANTPSFARHVVLITMCETMNLSAANALLKTLEEPPGGTVFVLLSYQVSALPLTVRSRCFVQHWSNPVRKMGCSWLSSLGFDSIAIDRAMDFCADLPVLAWSLLNEPDLLKMHEQRLQMLEACWQEQKTTAELAEDWIKQGLSDNVDCLTKVVQAILRWQIMGRLDPLLVGLSLPTGQVSLRDLFALLDKLYENKQHLERGVALNEQLLLEQLMYHLLKSFGG